MKKSGNNNVKNAQIELDSEYGELYEDCTIIDDNYNIYLSVLPEIYQQKIDNLKRVIEGKYDLSYNQIEPMCLQQVDTKEQLDEKISKMSKQKSDKIEKLLITIKKTEDTLAKYKKQLDDMMK